MCGIILNDCMELRNVCTPMVLSRFKWVWLLNKVLSIKASKCSRVAHRHIFKQIELYNSSNTIYLLFICTIERTVSILSEKDTEFLLGAHIGSSWADLAWPHICSITIKKADRAISVMFPYQVPCEYSVTYYMKWKNLTAPHPLTHSFCSSLMGNLR